MKVWGREPAVWLAMVSAGLQTATAYGLDVSAEQQAWVTALVVALLGLVTAITVGDGILPAALGLGQAAMSLVVGFGLDWGAEHQLRVMAVIAVVLGLYVRTQVTAPVPAAVSPPGKLVSKI